MKMNGNPFTVETPDLAPDLDWMLQSGQVSQEVLAEAMVQEYASRLYRLAFCILGDPEEAQVATLETFVFALLQVYRYRSEVGVQTWLLRITVDICQSMQRRMKRRSLPGAPHIFSREELGARNSAPANELHAALWACVDTLAEKIRLPVLLHFVLGLPISEIAAILQIQESRVIPHLSHARLRLLNDLEPVMEQIAQRENGQVSENLDEFIASSLQARWPALSLSTTDQETITIEIVEQSAGRMARRKSLNYVKEMILVGAAILVVIILIWGGNAFIPEPQPTSVAQSTSPLPGYVQAEKASLAVNTQEPTSTSSLIAMGQVLSLIVQPGDTPESIATDIGIPLDELLRINRISENEELQPGQTLIIKIGRTSEVPLIPTPVTPAPQIPPLTVAAKSEDVHHRLLQSATAWNTLWADIRKYDYGPEGYVGPAQGMRFQVWINQPRKSLEIAGPLSGRASSASFVSGFESYAFQLRSLQITYSTIPSLLVRPELRNMIFPVKSDWISRQGTFRVVREEVMAGRQVLILDWMNGANNRERRLWLDAITGVILRQQEFGGKDFQTILSDTIVTMVAYDVDFPTDLFDLKRVSNTDFSRDFTGQPELNGDESLVSSLELAEGRSLLPYIPTPNGFDPSRSYLTFQIAQSPNPFGSKDLSMRSMADLFGGAHYLGRIEFGNPWNILCARSPDGLRVAFANNHSTEVVKIELPLVWFDLKNLKNTRRLEEEIYPTQFAFAPDSRHLAYFARSGEAGDVSILDLDSGESRQLLRLNDAKSLVWSPDGEYLAMIGRERSPLEDEVMVLRVSTGDVVFRDPVDVGSGKKPIDWPMLEWGVEFPVEMGGLEACAAPPGG